VPRDPLVSPMVKRSAAGRSARPGPGRGRTARLLLSRYREPNSSHGRNSSSRERGSEAEVLPPTLASDSSEGRWGSAGDREVRRERRKGHCGDVGVRSRTFKFGSLVQVSRAGFKFRAKFRLLQEAKCVQSVIGCWRGKALCVAGRGGELAKREGHFRFKLQRALEPAAAELLISDRDGSERE
jgi:hypothetical protein